MTKKTKVLAITLCLVIAALSFAACGSSSSSGNSTTVSRSELNEDTCCF